MSAGADTGPVEAVKVTLTQLCLFAAWQGGGFGGVTSHLPDEPSHLGGFSLLHLQPDRREFGNDTSLRSQTAFDSGWVFLWPSVVGTAQDLPGLGLCLLFPSAVRPAVTYQGRAEAAFQSSSSRGLDRTQLLAGSSSPAKIKWPLRALAAAHLCGSACAVWRAG